MKSGFAKECKETVRKDEDSNILFLIYFWWDFFALLQDI